MAYLIDTDWTIDHLANEPRALALLDRIAVDGIAISIITCLEAYEGVKRSPDPSRAEAKLSAFTASAPILPLSKAVARRCAQLRHILRSQGARVDRRALDLIIAATALEHGLILVSRNLEDFRDIPGLRLYEQAQEER
jgi:predicted nucleic acid-binding protein